MSRFLLFALTAGLLSPMAAYADERIWDTKNVCGLYYATEISGLDAARLIGLKGSGRVKSRVEQYCMFFRGGSF